MRHTGGQGAEGFQPLPLSSEHCTCLPLARPREANGRKSPEAQGWMEKSGEGTPGTDGTSSIYSLLEGQRRRRKRSR